MKESVLMLHFLLDENVVIKLSRRKKMTNKELQVYKA